MNKQENCIDELTLLRIIAEEELKTVNVTIPKLLEMNNLKLIHELQVYKIELEMQNEELKMAHEKAYLAIQKYVDLYDYAPSGYLSLSKQGEIIELNYAAATMLGNDRIHLKNKRFGLYIAHESTYTYNNLLHRTFILNKKESCEFLLLHKTDTVDKSMYVQVDAQLSNDNSKCLLTMTDISGHKKLEIELNKTVELLRAHNLL